MGDVLECAAGTRVLLLNPPVADTAEAEDHGFLASVAPYGLLRLATWFRARGASVTLLDALSDAALGGKPRRHVRKRLRCGDDGQGPHEKDIWHFGLDDAELEARLRAIEPPDLIAISSVFTWHVEATRDTIALCRRVLPRAKIVLGGNFPTLCPDVAATLGADEVFVGEVPGAEFAETAVDLLPDGQRNDWLRMVKGCPYHCSYCATSVLSRGRVHARSAESVFAEMQRKVRLYGTKNFVFLDDFALFQQASHLDPLLDLLAQERLGATIEFAFGIAGHMLDERLMRRMRDAGVERVYLALETLDPVRAKAMNRPQTHEQLARAVQIARDFGYSGAGVRVFYLIGMPEQTMDEILRAVRWLYEIEVTPKLTSYTLTPGTGDMARLGHLVAGRALDELAPGLWRFAHAGMTVRDLDDVYRAFDERWEPLEKLLDGPAREPMTLRLREVSAA